MKNSRSTDFVRKLCISAMLTALSIVIGIFCKTFLTWAIYYRVTFENLPIIFAGYCFGPVWGAAVGLAADIISCLCSPNPAVNPIISLGAVTVGALAGLPPLIFKGKHRKISLAISVSSAHLFGQVLIKSIGKIVFYSMPAVGILLGLAISAGVGTAEYCFMLLLLRSKGIAGIMKGMNKRDL